MARPGREHGFLYLFLSPLTRDGGCLRRERAPLSAVVCKCVLALALSELGDSELETTPGDVRGVLMRLRSLLRAGKQTK